ncbi:MAG TPA: adenylosuccinate synthetase, partial [Phycisphaerales bacterium]|nr:adenylosuccinate synthetase [Phycisphaerales bacterium]
MQSSHSFTTPHTAVVGLQWGDEGKGKVVDLLTAQHDFIVRYNGGANAGHTVVVGDQRYALHLIPSGIFSRDKTCVIGNGVVVDPEKLLQEIHGLRDRGIYIGENLRVSNRAHVVMPYHKEHDAAMENVLAGAIPGSDSDLSIGTTKRGIGPAYADKVHRSTSIRMGELLDRDLLQRKLRVICAIRTVELRALGVNAPPLDPDELAAQFSAIGRELAPHITDTTYLLHDALRQGRSMLFEGANACLLDIDHGTYPYVTSSNCSTLGIPAGTGVPGRYIQRVLGIMKAYATRVGAGPFPTEQANDTGNRIRERGREYGT